MRDPASAPPSRPSSPLSDMLYTDEPIPQNKIALRSRWANSPLLRPVRRAHQRIPGLKNVPLRALGIIGLLVIVNIIVWIAVAIVLVGRDLIRQLIELN